MADVKVKFLGDKTQLSRTIGQIKTESKGIGGGFTRAGSALKGMALPALGVGLAIFKMGQQAGKTADELFDMHDQTGISTDKLQEMRFVADQAGVAQDFYANSVKEVIKAQDELQKGTGPASEAMEALGVAVTNADGSMRSAEGITDEVIQRLQAIEDPTLRAALAQDIFKRKFEDILPVLGLGADAIDDMRGAAHELGAVQDGDALKSANNYRQGMEKLQVAVQDLLNKLMEELLPFITDTLIPGLMWLTEVVADLFDLLFGSEEFRNLHSDFDELNRLVVEGASEAEAWAAVYGGPLVDATDAAKRAVDKWKQAQQEAAVASDTAATAVGGYGAAIKSAADEVRKATDPAFALRKANEDFAAAEARVDELRKTGTANTAEFRDATSDLVEAQADLNFATEKYEEAGQTGIDALFELGEQARLTRDEIDNLVISIGLLNNAPISLGAISDPSDLFGGAGDGVGPTARAPEMRRFVEGISEELDRLNAEGI